MIDFTYNAEDAKPEYPTAKAGPTRVRIKAATTEEINETPVVKVVMETPEGANVYYDIWVRKEDTAISQAGREYSPRKMTARKFEEIFSAFEAIAEGDMNEKNWIGKTGGANLGIEGYTKKDGTPGEKAKVLSFLPLDKTAELPGWDGSEPATSLDDIEDSIPF